MSDLDMQLALYLAGALDPDETVLLRGRLDADPAAVARLDDLQQALAVPAAATDWRLPPPGVALGLRAVLGGVMGVRSARIGQSLSLALPSDAALDRHHVVLLRRVGADWRVDSPADPDQAETVADVVRAGPTGQQLSVRVRGPAGRQRLGLVLVPPDVWQPGPDWSWLLTLVEQGRVVAGTVDVDVRA